jgi:hypothetical protein
MMIWYAGEDGTRIPRIVPHLSRSGGAQPVF